jgi:hypothetical protein
MNPHELANDIVAIPFLKGLNDRHIRVLAGCACRIHFEKGTIIFHQGETANRFYLIDEGTIELEVALNSQGRKICSRQHRRWRGSRLVLAISAIRMAIHRACFDSNIRPLFLRNRPARTLRDGPLTRFRIVQTNGRGNGQAAAICAQALTGSRIRIFSGRCRACDRKRSVGKREGRILCYTAFNNVTERNCGPPTARSVTSETFTSTIKPGPFAIWWPIPADG